MDLKRYRKQIQNELLSNIQNNIIKNKAIQEGNYKPKIKGSGSLSGKVLTNMDIQPSNYGYGKLKPLHLDFDNSIYNDSMVNTEGRLKQLKNKDAGKIRKMNKNNLGLIDDDNDITGGKINFVKSFKKVGKTLGKDAKNLGKTIKKQTINTVGGLAGKEAGQAIYSGLKNVGSKMMLGAEEAAPILEEGAIDAAPLLLAGKVKRTRKISQKEENRHKLIRQLMNKHNISLIEASKYIKSHNLKY
jgi:hypothetical protein